MPRRVLATLAEVTRPKEMTYAELKAALPAQNAHRATLGLQPLPDPATVTHGAPGLPPAAPGTPTP